MSSEFKRVGFIGLGIMGRAMAGNIQKAGYALTVFNRTSQRCEPFAQAGAKVSPTPAALAAECDVIVSCVSDTPDVLDVILDKETGVIAGVKQGAIVIDCSTVAPTAAQQCSEALLAKGAGFLDAPVSGGDIGAQAGTLSIMVGGEKADFDRALPIFQTMGKTITHCGPSGAGYTVKLCNQILGATHLLAAAEAVSLAESAGVDAQAMLQAVSSGAAGSWMLTNLAPKMVTGDYAPGFFVDYQLKDLRLAHEAAHRLNTPLPTAALAETMFRAASSQGFGKEGTQAISKIINGLKGNSQV